MIAARRTSLLLALNLVVLALWLWARTEQLTIDVAVTPAGVAAYDQAGRLLASAPPLGTAGNVGLYLSQRLLPGRTLFGGSPFGGSPPGFLAWLGRESAWETLTVRQSDGTLLFQGDLASGLRRFLPGEPVEQIVEYGNSTWADYTVEATLLRGREQAGIEVLGTATGGRVFLFRPEHRDGGWQDWTPAGFSPPLATIPWGALKKPLLGMGQDVLRLFLGAYPAALLLGLLFGGLGLLGRLVRRPNPLTPFPAREGGTESGDEPNPLAPFPAREGGTDAGDEPNPLTTFSPVRGTSPARDGGGGSSFCSPFPAREGGQGVRLALALSAIGFALGAYVATYHLERIPHVQDSVGYLFQANVFALGHLWVPVPALPEFFNHEFVVMYDGKWFAKYPPGHPILLALGVLAGAPWLISPIAAGLSVFLVYLIGRRAYGWPTGLLAAGLALVSPFFIFLSGSFMAHATGLLFVLLFVWLFLRADRPLAAALCGVALGFGFLIRPWTDGVIAAPFALVALASIRNAPRKRLSLYLAMALGFIPFVVGWLAYNAALTGDPLKNTMEMWWIFDKVGFGPDHGPFGFTPLDGLFNTSRNMYELQAHLFGWPPYLAFLFVTLPFVLLRARRHDWLFLAGFLSLATGYFFWWADGIMFGPRFYYESLGFLLLLTARGVFELAGLIRRALERWTAGPRKSRAVGGVLAGGLLALLVAYNLYFYLPVQWQLYRGYNYVNRGPVRAVESAGLKNALVFAHVGEWYEWWNYGMVFSSNSPLLDGDVVYARDLGDEENRRLMALYPDRSYYRLRGSTLTPLAGPGQ